MISSLHTSNLLWQRTKRRLFQHIWVLRALLIVGVITVFASLGFMLGKPLTALAERMLRGPRLVSTFFTDPLYTLPSTNGRVNILFLGMGGGDHDGPQLTDTMIFTSLNLKDVEVTMLSIPRDIWVPSLESKINAAYMIGEQKEVNGGYPLVEDAVYEIVNQPIHYVVSLDFNGFVQLIDLLGGVDVKVERSFVDEQYPVKGKENDLCNGDPEYKCRYETLRFVAGEQHMDGTTALKFSRSRHAQGEEGTDFARSARQQKLIEAVKDKLVSSKILLNPGKLLELKQVAMKYIKIDRPLSDQEYAAFAGFAVSFWRSDKAIKTLSLDMGTEDNPGFLINPPETKYDQWVLEPRGGSWTEFQTYFNQKLNEVNQ